MATRRRTVIEVEPDADEPFRDAMRADAESVAEQFSAIVEEFGGVADGSVRGHLYRVERSGKFQWIGEYWPPFDQAEIFREMREKYNGGDYQLRIMVTGRRGVQKTVTFSIAPAPAGVAPAAAKDNSSDMLIAMMQMQQSAADRQMQMMMTMGQQTQAMFAAMQASQTSMMSALIPAMMGGQTKMGDLMPLIAAMKPDGGGMKDTLEMLTVAKTLFKDGDGDAPGFDPDNLVGSALKLAGPIAGAIGKAVSGARQAPQAEQVYEPNPDAMMQLPPPMPDIPPATPGRFPALTMVADDILFMAARSFNPELAAEAVMDKIEAAGIGEDQINEMVTAFVASADPWGDLASEGLDLRPFPTWAPQFVAALVRAYAEGDDDDTGGDGGGRARRSA